MAEVWKPIATWEKYYHISSYGRIKRLARIGTNDKFYPVKILSGSATDSGYVVIKLIDGDRLETIAVHILVARAFLGLPLETKLLVVHINDDLTDNREENLVVVPSSLNSLIGRGLPTRKVRKIDRTGIETVYPSVVEAAKANNILTTSIYRYLKKESVSRKKDIWDYVDS